VHLDRVHRYKDETPLQARTKPLSKSPILSFFSAPLPRQLSSPKLLKEIQVGNRQERREMAEAVAVAVMVAYEEQRQRQISLVGVSRFLD